MRARNRMRSRKVALRGPGAPACDMTTARSLVWRCAGVAGTGVAGTASAGTEVAGTEVAGTAGPQLARAVLDAARAKRGERNSRNGRPGGSAAGSGRRLRGYSGSGPDPRDPQPFAAVLARLVKTRGWEKPAAEARIFGTWAAVVGADLAEHSRPTKLEDGELTVEAESTAWATQLRLLTGKLLGRIANEIGAGVVTQAERARAGRALVGEGSQAGTRPRSA